MKKMVIITCLVLRFSFANGQIVTPAFIRYSSCPDQASEVSRCTGWRQPTGGTSDYFNACAAATISTAMVGVGVPENSFGYQMSVHNAYVGLFTYYPGMLFYREYVATSIAPLTVGKTYNMTISVSLANNSRYATDGLGVFFSTYPINQPHLYTYLPVTPQVDYSNYGVITDTMNWVTLSKTFVADSAYTNLVVGCFKSDYTIKVKSFAKGVIEDFTLASYYYISRIGIPDSMSNDTTEEITVMPNITMYEFPNGFTPNGDGNNDIFRIIANMNIVFKKYSLSIYNRYGQLVFFTEDPADGWNGKFNDVPQDMGAYFYMAVLTVNDKEEVMKGDITLIR